MFEVEFNNYSLVVIGAGGTGSNFVRLAGQLLGSPSIQGSLLSQYIVDGDIIEESNCKRQAFQKKEINLPKAAQLAMKCNSTYQTEFRSIDHYIEEPSEIIELFDNSPDTLPILIGAVDNHSVTCF